MDDTVERDDTAEPTTFAAYQMPIEYDNDVGRGTINVELWNTAGQEKFHQLRQLSYPGTDIYLMVYSCDDPRSLESLLNTWLPEA